ncbi:uncharacterized protein J7T54_005110 [Emericellopsis cladophorae]|uniref:Uncharacterized protein n=1 Tax=Emericellopsis cladophorae TaxID=2686198 RepID=A0A9P9Y206_9HYPO|nr:uncharacterized protein J7T54_005110 [Emericellopsis cladophorae]KAI6781900.1 hypothetical protein J7T54_005110 [Emericellopsis cladophorae]
MLFSTKTFVAVVAVLARATAAAPGGSTDDALARQQDVAREARQLQAVTATAATQKRAEADAVEKRQFCDCPEGKECIDPIVLASVGTLAPMAHCVTPTTKRDIEARAAEVERRQQRAEAEAVEKRDSCACPEGFVCMAQSFEMLAIPPQTMCVPTSFKRDIEGITAEVQKRQVADTEGVEKRSECDCAEGQTCSLIVVPPTFTGGASTSAYMCM